jgi:hypothetical protein
MRKSTYATTAFMDEAGHILIEGMLTQTIWSTANQFSEIERLSIALLHDHDIELFSGLDLTWQHRMRIRRKLAMA